MEMHASLIYADEQLAVFNKPAGLSLATPRSEPGAAARRLLESLSDEESSDLRNTPLFLVHRLDVGTTGLVLVARDEQTHCELSEQLGKRLIEKTYRALAWGHPRPPAGSYQWPIGADRRDRRRMKVEPGGRPAVTEYRTLTKAPHVALLELRPKTGRTHQIRVHLSRAGHWIVGDDLYGGARHRGVKESSLSQSLNPPHLLLHAWRLQLPESLRLRVTKFEAPLPLHFKQALEALHIEEAQSLPEWPL
jgi:23S rRNA pseudouridine1911/1915/1917 synthase